MRVTRSPQSESVPAAGEAGISDSTRERIQAALEPGEELRVAVESDLELSGQFGEAWLVVTNERVLSLAAGDGLVVGEELPLGQVRGLGKRDFLNSGVLELETEETTLPVLRFTHARMDAILEALPTIRELLAPPTDAGQEVEHPRRPQGQRDSRNKSRLCAQCGKPKPHWMGVCPDCLDKRGLLVRLFARTRRYWPQVSGSFLMMFLALGMENVQPLLQKTLVDNVLNTGALPMDARLRTLAWIMVALLGVRVGLAIISSLRGFVMNWLGERITFDLRTEMYDHLQRLSLSYYDQKETGWIMDRVTSDTGSLQEFLTNGVQETLSNILSLVVIAILMFSLNPSLAMLSLLPAPIILVMSAMHMRRTHKLYHRQWRRRSRVFALLANVIPGVRVVKAFAQEDRERGRFARRSEEYMRTSVDTYRTQRGFTFSTMFLMSLSYMAIWGYGGYLVVIGAPGATVGTLMAFMTFVMRFYNPLQNLARMSQQIQRAATSAQRVFEVLDAQPDVAELPHAKQMPPIRGTVEFKNVTFGYEPHTPVLKDLSFKVEPGEMIGLVGPSGAGKSTTINLICRFYDVTEGAIEIDGVDLRDVTLRGLRDQIGVVLQEPFLFHGTVAENIAYGNPSASREKIIEAARAANAHEFIMRFPDGYDTMVGERGQRLSGGERQRISIARAILKNPRLLILDEATASVDTETEEQIRQAIDRLVAGRTTFAIAHRFSTLQQADRLIVLDNGRLVEMGTHEELLAIEDGLFRRLCEKQAQMSRLVAVGG